ncbi:MAG: recombination mediator RecR [Pseudomonadota bacterium]
MGYRLASLEGLIKGLASLPGIGEKTATRLALHIVRMKDEEARLLARGIIEVKDKVGMCSSCFNLTERDPCPICSNPDRSGNSICVVEGPADLMAIERAGGFGGAYHVLHGVLAPMDGIGPEELRLTALLSRVERGAVKEVVLATNPSVEGEATAAYIAKALAGRCQVSRIAYGIPFGGDVKYCDDLTLKRAMEARRAMD